MKYDIIVVGAGPAGSTAAKILANKGFNIFLVDKEKFPRDKPCGGGLPIRTIKRFPYIKDIDVIDSYSYGGYLYSTSFKHKAEILKQEPVIATVLRKKFDNALVNLAIDEGVVFKDGKSVIDLKINSDNAKITLDDGNNIQADLVIGADGFSSIISRKANLFTRNRYMGISVVEEFPLKKNIMNQFYTDKRFCHIYSKIYGIMGYGWVFPKKNHVNIGLAEYRLNEKTEDKKNLKQLFLSYLALLKNSNLIPKNVESTKLRGGILPVKPLKKTYNERVLICGDAAGFINPVTGEGIYYAFSSGEIAAKIAAESISINDTSEKFLSNYEKQWNNDFGKEINFMLRSTKQWGKKNENIIKLSSKDKKLAEMLLSITTGQESIYELRWKIIKRYLYVYLKYLI